MYTYNAELIKVVDGDTVWVRVDLGFRLYRDINLRVGNINAPEMKTAEGKIAKSVAQTWFVNRKLVIKTERDPGSYDRYTAEIVDAVTGEDFGKYMVDSGNAVAYIYKWS